MSLQAAMPMSEQRAYPGSDDGCQRTQRHAQLKGKAVAHNGFPAVFGCHTALVSPLTHASHRGLLVEAPAGLQVGNGQRS